MVSPATSSLGLGVFTLIKCPALSRYLWPAFAAVAIFVLFVWITAAKRERAAEIRVEAFGGSCYRGFDPPTRNIKQTICPDWISSLVGIEYIGAINYVYVPNEQVSDPDLLDIVRLLPKLKGINLSHTNVTYAGVEDTLHRRELFEVQLFQTKIPEEDIDRLRRKFPNVQIMSDANEKGIVAREETSSTN